LVKSYEIDGHLASEGKPMAADDRQGRREASAEHGLAAVRRETFSEIAADYAERWEVGLCAVGPEGGILFDRGACAGCEITDEADCEQARAFALSEGLRWGEPSVTPCPAGACSGRCR
jgi:hypothetical protein